MRQAKVGSRFRNSPGRYEVLVRIRLLGISFRWTMTKRIWQASTPLWRRFWHDLPIESDALDEVARAGQKEKILIGAIVFGLLFFGLFARLVHVVFLETAFPTARTNAEKLHTLATAVLSVLVNAAMIFTLYTLRCRAARIYGMAEISVALFASFIVFNQIVSIVSFDARSAVIFSLMIAQMGALYIGVRGLDNIYNSIPPGPRKERWHKIFYGEP